MSISGVMNLYKPVRASSAYYAYRLRRVFGVRRVGHAGALDPFADGVLVACVGPATRLVERLMGLTKVYETTLQLGVTNATLDPEFPPEPVAGAAPPTLDVVRDSIRSMTGDIEQVPPVYSSVKLQGRPARRLAMAGRRVELRPRTVRNDAMEVLSYAWPLLSLRIVCGRGTYIRAVARDLGARWGCGAICQSLRRTRIGPFTMDRAMNLHTDDYDKVRAALHSPMEVLDLLEAEPSFARSE